jgi:acyl dehydratase
VIVDGLSGLRALVGVASAPTQWFVVDQERVDAFAACTGDAQWIHVDVDRAKRSEFGGTIVHGYLTLALIPMLFRRHFDLRGVAMGLNAGLDRVRWPAPLPVGGAIRARFDVLEARDTERGLRLVTRVTIEARGTLKPVCVADTIAFYRGSDS